MKGKESVNRIIQIGDTNIGDNIRKLREKADYHNQADFVRKLQIAGIDISVYSYNRVEKGTQNPTVSLLFALCDLLHCDMNDIFGINKTEQ